MNTEVNRELYPEIATRSTLRAETRDESRERQLGAEGKCNPASPSLLRGGFSLLSSFIFIIKKTKLFLNFSFSVFPPLMSESFQSETLYLNTLCNILSG